MKAGCLEESTVLAFLGGALLPDARSGVEEHIATCGACAELVTWAAADQTHSTVRMPGHEGRPFVGHLHAGARVGRYQILNPIGRGGMGEVYAAYHPDLDRRIALKVVHGLDSGGGERRKRLLREARAIARLSHPNVVAVHDAGAFGDRVYIAMELIDGRTVEQWLRAEPRTWQQVLDVFVAAGRGLAAAHTAGIVHRDFKPDNVMIAKNGAVRVMDFGLARISEDDAGDKREPGDDESTRPFNFETKTGAIIGTPAYMSPEQFRREAADARSDQFSFCVALHEALFGARPPVGPAEAEAGSSSSSEESSGERFGPAAGAGAPGWLRAVVLRGSSLEREQRYPTMEALLAALEAGRRRVRRRVSVAAIALATLLLAAGAWRLGYGNAHGFTCSVPGQRVAAVWPPGDDGNARRQSIHRAFAASGRATAGTSWQRLARALDDYMTAWAGMYVETCEATHVRGEQSGEVLDLRMSCLRDDLDRVRALTDALVTADAAVVSRAVTAAADLPPLQHCADVTQLRSAVPLPRDDAALREVETLRSAVRDLEVLRDVGDNRATLDKALALRPRIEATGYKPLLAQVLDLTGHLRLAVAADATEAEANLREGLLVAQSCGDDVAAVKTALGLSYVLTYRLGRVREGEFISQLATSILDRMGPGNDRLRAWSLETRATVAERKGDYEGGAAMAEASVALLEKALGREHPEVAIGLNDLAFMALMRGRGEAALAAADRAVDIFAKHGDPDGFQLAITLSTQGDALNALGRHADAEQAFEHSLRIFREQSDPNHPEIAYPTHGLGETRIAQRRPADAIPLLRQALHICAPDRCDPVLVADTTFSLARATWDSGGDRAKATELASAALATYRRSASSRNAATVESWLAAHRRR